MKKTINFIQILIYSLGMLALTIAPGFAAGTPEKVNYVAFGDSVAAGVRGGVGVPGSELESDKGYTDKIASMLEDIGILGSFNEDFCISGETAKGLAQKTAVLNDADSSAAILVNNADLITLDIGANDLLYPLYEYFIGCEDYMDFEINTAKQLLNQVIDDLYNGTTGTDAQNNIKLILQNMLAANDKANIYVMGYYNPLPTLSTLLDIDLNEPTKYFNTLIQEAVSDIKQNYPYAEIFYVSTFDAMAAATDSLVATDIHPTEAGYRVISEEFWEQIKLMDAINQADALVSVSQFTVNDASVPLNAYIINNNNYIKLRDFAMVLNGTAKQIDISWDGTANVVTIISGKEYTPVGGELSVLGDEEVVTAKLNDFELIMDGVTLNLTAYNIEANTYIKLRDLTEVLNIGVTWDSQSNTVNFDLNKSYAPPTA